jgi:hypothetical protein
MAMAHSGGAAAILVLSGEATRAEAEAADPAPHYVLEHVGALAEMLKKIHPTPTVTHVAGSKTNRSCAPATSAT